LGYLIIRAGFIGPKAIALGGMSLVTSSPAHYFAAWTKLTGWYLSKLIVPVHIVAIYDITIAPEEVLRWIGLSVLMVGVVVLLFKRYRQDPAASLGLWWLALSFIPVAAACFSRPEMGLIIQPHWFLFGSLGFFLWLAAIFVRIRASMRYPLWIGMLVILLVSLMITSIHQNKFWADQKTYCRYWLTYAPNNFWANFSLGNCYYVEKNYALAKIYYLRAAGDGKAGSQVWTKLAMTEHYLGNTAKAKYYFQEILRHQPNDAVTRSYLGLN